MRPEIRSSRALLGLERKSRLEAPNGSVCAVFEGFSDFLA